MRTDGNSNKRGRIAVVGMFDGVHTGHRHLLASLRNRAAALGLEPLAVTFSNHPMDVIAPEKAPKLLSTPEDKLLRISAEGVEVEMIPFDAELRATPAAGFMRMLRERWGVRCILLGYNNRFGSEASGSEAFYNAAAAAEGMTVERYTEFRFSDCDMAVSSSSIRRMIESGELSKAGRILGREYDVAGIVAHGKAIGRTIGFPTANVVPDFTRKLIPAGGVYAAWALTVSGRSYPAMVNIGYRPTINSDPTAATIEAYLHGFSGELYDTRLTLSFVERIRGEERFENLEALRQQIESDRVEVLKILQKQGGIS